MSDMGWSDYVSMVEDTAVRTHLIEYRLASDDGGPGDLVAVFCAGAYGASASPANFLGQGPARELLV